MTDEQLKEWASSQEIPIQAIAKVFDKDPSFYRTVLMKLYSNEMEAKNND